ncbi:hypothetical protein BCV70DRAFT_215191 [Testicularia cyperi]|uniref:Roadblock/LAMTOR2 domain-containing protein n=1 Tax=Testicularia cyperi TaxID=1882483 RepID=A0A317XZW9_9BASI|nr:hypothetical protein BCV70DRAFT_215191 [Testicularia cyperi]
MSCLMVHLYAAVTTTATTRLPGLAICHHHHHHRRRFNKFRVTNFTCNTIDFSRRRASSAFTDTIMTEAHAVISPEAISQKPHPLSSTPHSADRKSPMPPCSASTASPPAEIEATLTRLSMHQGVLGCLVLSRHDGLVIRSGGSMFDPTGPGAKERAELLKKVVKLVKSAVSTLADDVKSLDDSDELGFLRIRSKKYEIMITPNDKYLLVVLQDPHSTQ